MTAFETVEITKGEPKRDRWGRYLLPDPLNGGEAPWTRATTISNTLKDRYGLEKWEQRNIIWGIGQRPDLFARASAAKRSDESTLSEIAGRASEAAAAQAGALVGSAIHQFTERLDAGEEIEIPEPYATDVAAYVECLRAHDINVVPHMIERIVGLPSVKVAGTLDRIADSPSWGLPRILDVKTTGDGVDAEGRPYNKILKYGMVDIPIQLAIYAHADLVWNGADWESMPAVDQEVANVAHVVQGGGECRLYEVDIREGWRALQLALDVREWRKRKDLATVVDLAVSNSSHSGSKGGEGSAPVDPPARPASADEEGAPDTPSSSRLKWLENRVEVIKAHELARARLAALWKKFPEIPTFKRGGPTSDEQIDRIAGCCALVEMEYQLSFPDEDPAEATNPRKPS